MLDLKGPRYDVATEIFECLNATEVLLYNQISLRMPFKSFTTKRNARSVAWTEVQVVVHQTVLSVPELSLFECFRVDQFA